MLSKYIYNRIFSYIGLNSDVDHFEKKKLVKKKRKLEDKIYELAKKIKNIDNVDNTLKYYRYIKKRIQFMGFVDVLPAVYDISPVFIMVSTFVSLNTLKMLDSERLVEFERNETYFHGNEFDEVKARNYIQCYLHPINVPHNIYDYLHTIKNTYGYTIEYFVIYPLIIGEIFCDANFAYVKHDDSYEKYKIDTDMFEKDGFLVHKSKLKI